MLLQQWFLTHLWPTLPEKCLNTEFSLVCIPVFVLNIGKDGPEKNSVFGHFSRSAKFPFYFPRLKTPDNHWFSSVFRGYNLEALATNG